MLDRKRIVKLDNIMGLYQSRVKLNSSKKMKKAEIIGTAAIKKPIKVLRSVTGLSFRKPDNTP